MTIRQSAAKNLCLCAMFSALMAICSWISIPTTVPFTLQTFAVFVALSVLGGKAGTVCVVVYVLMGAMGIPVFSGFKGGIGVLAGPTGGYIFGFIFTALTVWLCQSLFGNKTIVTVIAMIAGLLMCYTIGTLWFVLVYVHKVGDISIGEVLGMCVFPFSHPDMLKLFCAVILSGRIKRRIKIS